VFLVPLVVSGAAGGFWYRKWLIFPLRCLSRCSDLKGDVPETRVVAQTRN